jgi:hypothetical protein
MRYLAALVLGLGLAAAQAAETPAWVEPMKEVHGKFKGTPGTFAHFGDSITVTLAFWSPLQWERRNAGPSSRRRSRG